jgi:hypothetical protein
MQPAQDLVALARHDNDDNEPPTQETIFNVLTRRHQLGLPYTRVGTSTLVAMNPNQALNIYSDLNSQTYIDATQTGSTSALAFTSPAAGSGASLEPHVYELACTMYYHMRRTEQDQGVILRYVFLPFPFPLPRICLYTWKAKKGTFIFPSINCFIVAWFPLKQTLWCALLFASHLPPLPHLLLIISFPHPLLPTGVSAAY